MRALRARDIMSTPVIAVRWDASVPDIVSTMRRHAISGVPVLDEFGLLCGIVTEANILEKEAGAVGLTELSYRRSGGGSAVARQIGSTAEEIMIRNVVTAKDDEPVRELARTMVRCGINRIPIMDREDLVGIVTRADILAVVDGQIDGVSRVDTSHLESAESTGALR